MRKILFSIFVLLLQGAPLALSEPSSPKEWEVGRGLGVTAASEAGGVVLRDRRGAVVSRLDGRELVAEGAQSADRSCLLLLVLRVTRDNTKPFAGSLADGALPYSRLLRIRPAAGGWQVDSLLESKPGMFQDGFEPFALHAVSNSGAKASLEYIQVHAQKTGETTKYPLQHEWRTIRLADAFILSAGKTPPADFHD
ncbi:MAG TPA: hypothetical protein VGO11_10670 [Chthoniobacteraceae bacterium]|jgi:hypothetical protein|nr:hypothetical protein [Chthoniobacteraceae bacterium]